MALVSYGVSSDEYSDEETDVREQQYSVDVTAVLPKAQQITKPAAIELDNVPLMPRKLWEKEEALRVKPPKTKVKITLPALPSVEDSDDEEINTEPKVIAPKKGTKLLNMLPAPTTSKPQSKGLMLPNSLSRKSVAKPKPKSVPKTGDVSLPKKKKIVNEEDNEEEEAGDFFGFNTNVAVPVADVSAPLPVIFEGPSAYGPSRPSAADVEMEEIHPSQMYNMANVPQMPEDQPGSSSGKKGFISDEKARAMIRKFEIEAQGFPVVFVACVIVVMLKLVMNIKGDLGETDFVDVSVDKRLGNVQENILRNLSGQGDVMEHAKRLKDIEEAKPGDLAKKKHQITYLAYMAKQKEESLKEQWSQNKFSRRQTQQKYGF